MGFATLGYSAEILRLYSPMRPLASRWTNVALEFSRISKSRGGALTLVVDPENGIETTVSYCVSARAQPFDAIEDLRVREGPTRKEWIGSFRAPFEQSRYFHAIRAWAS